MNATERAALLEGLELHEDLTASVDDRTLEILDQRRRTTVVRRRGWLMRRMLLAADVVGLILAMLLAESIVDWHSSLGVLDGRAEVVLFLASLPGWVVVAKLYGLYDHDEERTDHSTTDDFVGVFHLVTVSTWGFFVLCFVTGIAHPTMPKLVLFWASGVAFVTLGRSVARTIARHNLAYLQNTVIVGAGDVGQMIARKLLQHPEYGLNVVGFVDAHPRLRTDDLDHLALLGAPARLPAIIRLFDIERVVIAFSSESHEDTLELARSLNDFDLQIDIVPRLFEMVGPRAGINVVEGIPLVAMPATRLSSSSLFLKRSLDLVAASVILVVLQPLLWLVALLVKLDSPGPIFYRDQRVGRRGEVFRAIKFRSMRIRADELLHDLLLDPLTRDEFDRTHKLANDPRVTRLGALLRRTSLDELPQLINVIAGQMSLVGPRPITQLEYVRYRPLAVKRSTPNGYWESNIRPGLTGYWQINGRSSMDYSDRLRLDAAYVTNWSLALDLEILAKTVRVLLSRRGAT